MAKIQLVGAVSWSSFCLCIAHDDVSVTGNDGGWDLHILSTVCEWISALSLDFFILTFAREFHSISLTSPRVMFVVERLSLPTLESNPMTLPNYDQVRNVSNKRTRTNRQRTAPSHSRSSSLEPLTDPVQPTSGHHSSFTSSNQVIIQ